MECNPFFKYIIHIYGLKQFTYKSPIFWDPRIYLQIYCLGISET